MLFGYFTLFVALLIEVVAAYYSITGLAAIFSGAIIPILIMDRDTHINETQKMDTRQLILTAGIQSANGRLETDLAA